MARLFFILVFSFLLGCITAGYGQYYPVGPINSNSAVHNFRCAAVEGATEYRFYVCEGNDEDYAIINTKAFARVASKTPEATVFLTGFFKFFSWFSVAKVGTQWQYSGIKHCTLNGVRKVDLGTFRLNVKTNKLDDQKRFVVSDVNKVIYDMTGRPIWYLPVEGGIRDLKISPLGLLTGLEGDVAQAYNSSGEVVWRAPESSGRQGKIIERYHHEIIQRKNGNFVVMSIEPVILEWLKDKSGKTTLVRSKEKELAPGYDSLRYTKTGFGTLIEYTKAGKVVWYWSSANYYLSLPGFKSLPPGAIVDVHENAFFFDEGTRKVYVNAKGASDILKIDYPSGRIIAHYGDGYGKNKQFDKYKMFCDQHGIKRFSDGNIYVFNNNLCSEPGIAKVSGFEEANAATGQLKKVWEYEYTGLPDSSKYVKSTNGGCVQDAGKGALFACYGVPLSSMFIVGKNKELLWDAMLEKKDKPDAEWTQNGEYRAYLIQTEAELLKFLGLKKAGRDITNE